MHLCNFHYKAMADDITDFEICGFHTNFFYASRATLLEKNSFVMEVTFNTRNKELNFKTPLKHYKLSPFLISLVIICTLMRWLEALSDLLKVRRASKYIFLKISLLLYEGENKRKNVIKMIVSNLYP